MKHLSGDTRVLVADGAYALVLRNDGDGAFPNLSLGRKSAMEATDWHRVAEDRFVQRVADDMAKDLSAGAFTDLVLAAPPVALGEFRKAATSALTEATILELDKDLTKHPIDKIEKIVVKALEDADG
jgi:protein required for attachment to host cells